MAELKILDLVSGNHFDIKDEKEDYDGLLTIYDKNRNNEKKTIILKKKFEWFLSEEFKNLREGFIPDGKSKYDDKRIKLK